MVQGIFEAADLFSKQQVILTKKLPSAMMKIETRFTEETASETEQAGLLILQCFSLSVESVKSKSIILFSLVSRRRSGAGAGPR